MRHANGISSPWTTGEEPARALADNPRLSGTATWTGGLVGFTPELRSAGGNAELSVELVSMDGRAAFTELQSWATGSAPGALGSGETVEHREPALHDHGRCELPAQHRGNAGTVNGQFYGTAPEGVAGSLERDDFTAAFGARRDR